MNITKKIGQEIDACESFNQRVERGGTGVQGTL